MVGNPGDYTRLPSVQTLPTPRPPSFPSAKLWLLLLPCVDQV